MEYYLKPSALKNLRRLPHGAQQKIIAKLDFYVRAPDPLAFAEKLTDHNSGEWRFRVGEYRLIFDVRNNNIIVLKIGHRKEIYKYS